MATTALRAGEQVKELTLRGIILGALITVVFTAANVYLGLKIGITFATSIPAAVISMAVLKAFRDSTIQENNIVQTIASAARSIVTRRATPPCAKSRPPLRGRPQEPTGRRRLLARSFGYATALRSLPAGS